MTDQPAFRLEPRPPTPPPRTAMPMIQPERLDVTPKERRVQEFWMRSWREQSSSRFSGSASLAAAALETIADLAPSPGAVAFLVFHPHLLSFLKAAKERLGELIKMPFQTTLRLCHDGDGVILVARLDGTVDQARALMERFDEEWLLKLPPGWDEGATVDIRASRT